MRPYWLISVGALGSFVNLAMCQAPDARSLFDALGRGDASSVRAVVEKGPDINIRDADGNTLLLQAAVYTTVADLEFLLARGADVNAANHAGHTALMGAIPDLGKVKLLVEHGADVNASARGTTPLLMAAGIRSAGNVVRYLIKQGADTKAIDAQGSDAVMVAALAGASDNLKILLSAGASGTNEAKPRQIPQAQRIAKLDESAVDRLKKRAERVTALMNAARVDCESCVRMLLVHGADAKARTDAGLTTLHYAAFKGNLTVVRLLLDAGAPVNVADDRGLTPLMMAANSWNKNPEVVRVLLERGADIHAKDEFGRTAADWAQIGARREIIALLPGGAIVEPAKVSPEPAFKNTHDAVAKSIALLEEASPKFFPKSGCISCHNVSIPLIALTQARRFGYSIRPAATQLLEKQTIAVYSGQRDNLMPGACGIAGSSSVASYSLVSLKEAGYAPDSLTDAIVRCLSAAQYEDGHWHLGIDTRPPLSAEGDIPETALSAFAMKSYLIPALAGDLGIKVARARGFLASAKPVFGSDYPFRLLGLSWTSAAADQIQAAARELLAQQRSDGGWAQNSGASSDAYETGLSLSALIAADSAFAKSAEYRRGVDYLLRTQEADGSWHVRSRAFGFQPYFESGFPHGHDQWISMAATAWSAMALMPAAEVAEVRAAR
jgi:ankyrin repeat protein